MVDAVAFWNEPNSESHWAFAIDPPWAIFAEIDWPAKRQDIHSLARLLACDFEVARRLLVRTVSVRTRRQRWTATGTRSKSAMSGRRPALHHCSGVGELSAQCETVTDLT
jgi:hypothetical protein